MTTGNRGPTVSRLLVTPVAAVVLLASLASRDILSVGSVRSAGVIGGGFSLEPSRLFEVSVFRSGLVGNASMRLVMSRDV